MEAVGSVDVSLGLHTQDDPVPILGDSVDSPTSMARAAPGQP